ncbi:MAG: prepilin-type N-terminal cleavage/methylation domain-containing protein [bacterium]|nr:prepilin-type N-terminal cleavage/methylation domain-containing protein [bacterium]
MGFTLIELLMTLFILGIVVLVSVNFSSKVLEYNSLNTSAILLAKSIKMCQNISMEEGVRTRILLDFVDNKYHLIRVEKLPKIFSTYYLGNDIAFSWTNFSKKIIEFDPVGCPDMRDVGTPDKGGTIAIKSRSNRFLYIIITPVTGYVRISENPP